MYRARLNCEFINSQLLCVRLKDQYNGSHRFRWCVSQQRGELRRACGLKVSLTLKKFSQLRPLCSRTRRRRHDRGLGAARAGASARPKGGRQTGCLQSSKNLCIKAGPNIHPHRRVTPRPRSCPTRTTASRWARLQRQSCSRRSWVRTCGLSARGVGCRLRKSTASFAASSPCAHPLLSSSLPADLLCPDCAGVRGSYSSAGGGQAVSAFT